MTTSIEEFLKSDGLLLDVRSPKEFQHARIPGARNLPLFSDAERAAVGTLYKREGRDQAIRLGVKLVGPKLDEMLQEVDRLNPLRKAVRLYCWRGGMRSGFVSYFLHFSGHPTMQLSGGYKAFRRYAQASLHAPIFPLVIGGYTGVGKTEVLTALRELGEETVDLECLARHRGSAYGELLGESQPSSEQFENELASQLLTTSPSIWVEDESRLIGSCIIPAKFFLAMRRAPLFVLSASKEARVERIMRQYGAFPREQLVGATKRIEKRLGGATTKAVLAHILNNQLPDAILLLLDYYDRSYEYAIGRHGGAVIRLQDNTRSPEEWAKTLLDAKKSIDPQGAYELKKVS